MVAAGGDPDMIFALAELSFLHGEKAKRPEYRLAAAVYAHAFLFPEDDGRRPTIADVPGIFARYRILHVSSVPPATGFSLTRPWWHEIGAPSSSR